MSLTRRNNGCPQCRNRRLRCDKTEPECLKCLKKGLRCSGQGFECRFSSHVAKIPGTGTIRTPAPAPAPASDLATASATAPPPTHVSVSVPTPASASAPAPGRRRRGLYATPSPPQIPLPTAEVPLTGSKTALAKSPVHLSASPSDVTNNAEMAPQSSSPTPPSPQAATTAVAEIVANESLAPVLRPAIEPLSPQKRLLFQHFSDFIAAKMVVFDSRSNGYRDIILPIACQDEVVGRAVCAVAAFHLGTNASYMLAAAEAAQQAVLTKLLHDSMELTPRRVFTMSAWAAVLVLLVGDTITGSTNFIQLLEMLKHLAYSTTPDSSMPVQVRSFLLQQTKMFELFSSALTNERKGLELLSGPIEPYLDFAAYPAPHVDNTRYTNMVSIRSAIQAACGLCVRRMQNDCSYTCPSYQLDMLKQTMANLEPSVEGAHALVWTCFVAAAESVQPTHREFFAHRLGSLYECTKFNTIPKGLELLEVIWEKQGKKKWTELVTLERPLLII